MPNTVKKQKINPIRYWLQKLRLDDHTLLQRIFIGMGVITAMGILVHDTKFDQAVSLALPVTAVGFGLSSHVFDSSDNAHTHVERASSSQVFAGIPRIQSRDDRWSYSLPKCFSRGNLYFGGSRILWPSV